MTYQDFMRIEGEDNMSVLEEIQDFIERGYTKEQISQITGYELGGIICV